MKRYLIKIHILLVVSAIFLMLFPAYSHAGRLSEYAIVCGRENRCQMGQKDCIMCHYKETHYVSMILTLGLGNTSTEWDEYHCVTKGSRTALSVETTLDRESGKSPQRCSDTGGRGGKSGDVTDNYAWGLVSVETESGYNCVTDNLRRMYSSVCYSCIIVESLISAFTTAGAAAYDVSRSLANVILTVATVLWLSVYVLKSISSFATVEPMKMLQDIFIQLFKVLVAYVVVNSGISTIVEFTVVPLMNTGTGFANAIIYTLGGTAQ